MAELVLKNIHKKYGNQTIVNNLTLEIEKGMFVALLGPSGCGKTTTLRMLAGLENPDLGKIELNGTTLFDSSTNCVVKPEGRQMGMVFQSYALWPHMTVADNVGYPIKLKGIKGEEYQTKIIEALKTVKLEDKAQISPLKLSGGQRQRVALARCLIAEPKVILLDEPLSNLDRHLRSSMEVTFREFHRRTGATFIYVTHDQSEAMALADKIAVLNHGEIVQWGSPEDIYQKPTNKWLAEFIGNGSIIFVDENLVHQQLNTDQLTKIFNDKSKGEFPLVIRPQHVEIVSKGIPAQVIDSIYKGERYEVKLSFFHSQELFAFYDKPLKPCQKVYIKIHHAWGVALD